MDRPRHVLEFTALTLLALGLLMTWSAGMRIGPAGPGSAEEAMGAWLYRPATAYAGGALLVMLIVSRIDPRLWVRGLTARPIGRCFTLLNGFVLTAVVLTALALVPGIGVEVNGARRWLPVPGTSARFQPSELAKFATVLGVAVWAAWRGPGMRRFVSGLTPALLGLGLICGLIVLEDLGTAALIAVVGGAMLLAAGARWWHLGLPASLAGGVMWLAITSSDYRRTRLLAYLDPWADASGSGYHPIQSQLAFAMGGPAGSGLGQGVQKFGYLPEDTTDFIFAVLAEELGIVGVMLVVLAFAAILWAGMSVARRAATPSLGLIAFGCTLTLGLQAVINLAVVTVLVPTKGIALPLVSHGGTGWVCAAAAVGLISAIDRYDATMPTPGRGASSASTANRYENRTGVAAQPHEHPSGDHRHRGHLRGTPAVSRGS